MRDDRFMDIGVTTHETSVVIGGKVWEDDNFDGIFDEFDELPIEGETVTLWRYGDGSWAIHSDLEGNSSVTSDADGDYRFTVEATNYDQGSADYLQQYRYLVTVEREGSQRFSPASEEADDGIDNSVRPSVDTQWSDNWHLGYSREYVIIDTFDDGSVDVSTLRDDVDDFIGLNSNRETVKLGGTVWHDTNLDSIRDADELPIEGREVTLWALDANYLKPIEYRTTVGKFGFEKWAMPHAVEDTLIDSDVFADTTGYPGLVNRGNVGTMGHYELYETDEEGRVLVATLQDDLTKDAGVQMFGATTVIGGTVWIDSNLDGIRQDGEMPFAEQQVTLWERVDGEWIVVADVNGNSTQQTSKAGFYEFEVLPTDYDDFSAKFMQPREYRTTISAPEGYAMSEQSLTSSVEGDSIVSLIAQIFVLDETGIIDVALTVSDQTLDFPLVFVPVEEDLSNTGSDFNFIYPTLAVALGVGLIIFGFVRRRKDKEEEKIEA